MLVISNCANKLAPSEVSMKMFEIFTADARGSMIWLANGIRSSIFKAEIDQSDKKNINRTQPTGRFSIHEVETKFLGFI